MEIFNENNEFTTFEEAVNLSLTSMKSSDNQAESFSSISPLPIKGAIDSSKLDFVTPNAADNTPIQGWECYCWNTTTGYEVKFN